MEIRHGKPHPDKVRTWPFVSLNIRRAHLDDWTELARVAGRSRADLMREALEQVGLPYARSVARRKDAGSGNGSEKAALARGQSRERTSPEEVPSLTETT